MKKRSKSVAVVVIASAALMVLTGCSGGDPATPAGNGAPSSEAQAPTSDAAFDFTSNEAITGKTISFEIPEGLLVAATEYADSRFLDTVTVRGLETESAKFCAARLDFVYADGDSTRALIEDTDWDVKKETVDKYVLALGMYFGYTDAPQVGEPDLAELDATTIWIAPDGNSAVQVVECASSPYDPEAQTVTVGFTSVAPSGTAVRVPLAEASMSVMKNGDLTLIEHELTGFVLDSNGSWIED